MKTCETCKGTGQVKESITVARGDVVEVKREYNQFWTGLGVVVDTQNPPSLVMISGKAKGWRGAFAPRELTVVHGHIHIDRSPKNEIPFG